MDLFSLRSSGFSYFSKPLDKIFTKFYQRQIYKTIFLTQILLPYIFIEHLIYIVRERSQNTYAFGRGRGQRFVTNLCKNIGICRVLRYEEGGEGGLKYLNTALRFLWTAPYSIGEKWHQIKYKNTFYTSLFYMCLFCVLVYVSSHQY